MEENETHKDIELKSEEVQEVMNHIPSSILRYGISVLLGILLVLLVGSSFFSYPDTVDAEFTLTTQAPPAYIIANTAGRIAQLYVKNKQVIYEKDIIGVIQNTATTEDIFYLRENLKEWKFKHIITTPEAFGYMWECPDYFELDGKKFLSVSPQGLKREEFRFQNIYQSGYFPVKEDGSVDERDFREWDMGFDFYAPQTFTDNSGRRLLIGWMGMPDAEEEYTNKTIDEGWQHCLTVPRELRVKDGKIFQYPAKELERLRKEKTILDDEKSIVEVRVEVNEGFDLLIEDIAVTDRSFQISMGGQMLFKYENEIAEIGFSEIAGAGRNKRKAKVKL